MNIKQKKATWCLMNHKNCHVLSIDHYIFSIIHNFKFIYIYNFRSGFNIFNRACWKSPPKSCSMDLYRSRPDNSLNFSTIIFKSISFLDKKTLMIVSSSLSGPYWKYFFVLKLRNRKRKLDLYSFIQFLSKIEARFHHNLNWNDNLGMHNNLMFMSYLKSKMLLLLIQRIPFLLFLISLQQI